MDPVKAEDRNKKKTVVINGKTLTNLTEEEAILLEKKFASFKRLPVETNNVCPNYYNPYHDPRNCPGACRYCLWDDVLSEIGL